HSSKIRAERGIDRTPAVMPRKAAPDARPHLGRGEVELVVEDRQRPEVELVEAQHLLNSIAAVVHEGLRLEEEDAGTADPSFGDQAAEFLGPWREAVHLGDDVGGHEADIVSLQRIFRAGITEADPELHRRSLAGAAIKKKPPAGEGERFFRLQ